jgi:ABC-2 type transport system ATP-binding protein
MKAAGAPPILGHGLRKSFRRETGNIVLALDDVSVEARPASVTALLGPDGAGKTTLIRLLVGLMRPEAGDLTILGIDVSAHPQEVQDRIGYMPQKFGLYEDLSVQENLDLYADLQGVSAADRATRYPALLEMTALCAFRDRLAGRLSGGMKQKLGLACSLVRSPDLLVLDEPTVGVDPLSRRELWAIIHRLVNQEGLTVLMSTSYLDEAERCGHVMLLHSGRTLAQGTPAEITATAAHRTFMAKPPPGRTARGLQARLLDDPAVVDAVPEAGEVRFVCAPQQRPQACGPLAGLDARATAARFEDGFMALLRRAVEPPPASTMMQAWPPASSGAEVVVEVRDLVRRFGTFTAVDHIGFEVRRGEVFGLLGPNGAGKTTTFRMLCGLLPATSGTLRVAGMDLRFSRASARQRIGYVAQKFSLYGQLSVAENLAFFASAYGLRGRRRRERLAWAMQQFELTAFAHLPAAQLPGGYKQRLAMATALLHEPDIVFLDEPTSGADPLARREFWRRMTALAEQGVTVIVTTHFMEEAEYCDRVVILDAGCLLVQGTPAEIRRRATTPDPTMEDAFIAIVEQARASLPTGAEHAC